MRIEKLHLENIGVFDRLDLEFQTCQPILTLYATFSANQLNLYASHI